MPRPNPEIFALVLQHTGDGTVRKGGLITRACINPCKLILPGIIAIQPMTGPYPKSTLAIGEEAIDRVIGDRFFSKGVISVGSHLAGIKLIKSVSCAQPHETVGILNNSIHRALRQAV